MTSEQPDAQPEAVAFDLSNSYGHIRERIVVGTDPAGHALEVLFMGRNGSTRARFSHVCRLSTEANARTPVRIAPELRDHTVTAGPRPSEHPSPGSIDPSSINISPSILCEQCGLHGFVENGAWRNA